MADVKQIGFNHNVKHRGRPFHVQTEDSGVANPWITTHVFVGGNIIATKKTGYAERLGAPDLPRTIRELMEAQHKDVLRSLINGAYDDRHDAVAARATSYHEIAFTPTPLPLPKGAPAGDERPNLTPPPVLARAGAKAVPPPLPRRGAPTPAPRPPLAARDPFLPPDLSGEKSLDEVILSYLAEDPRDRK
jgi:hypothetical protein